MKFDAVGERREFVTQPGQLGDGEVRVVDADKTSTGTEGRGNDAARVGAGDLDFYAGIELGLDLLGVTAVGGEEGAPVGGEERRSRRTAEAREVPDVVEIGDEEPVEVLTVRVGGEVLEDPRAAGGEIGRGLVQRKMPPPPVLWPSLIAA